jgi:hypothetical protein
MGARNTTDQLVRTPSGRQEFRGIPFVLGPEDVREKSWIVLSRKKTAWAAARAEVPVHSKAGFVCLAQFCDWDENEAAPPGLDALEKVGQHLADVVLIYDDGSEHRQPVRRRFEVNSLSYPWGHQCFTAMPHRQSAPARLTDPLRSGMMWGLLQTSLGSGPPADGGWRGTLWLCAVENPSPGRVLRAVRFEARDEDLLAVCGITLFHGREDPLRYERLSLYRISLPEGEEKAQWEVTVDLGVVARTYQLPAFEPAAWLSSPAIGLGDRRTPARERYLYAEVSASPGATLTLRNARTGSRFEFDLSRLLPGQDLDAAARGARVEILERDKAWVHGKVIDTSTGRPTPVRLSFRSKDGRYIPPYGHRTEVNGAWFQDYGADVRRDDSSFAYVDGTFQIELPAGDVYLEMTKGFEHELVRKKLTIEPGQRELNLSISRFADLRSRGWVSADTHVHFLSPSTAVLEAQAEGLNLINLLAAQWGDLFTNVGDLSHGPLTSSDGETVVWVGTENRQHLLGHMALLGGRGEPVFPMSASGPGESYLGDPLWTTLADWADACRKREGLAVSVHFPYPTAEIAADIALNKIDAVELMPTGIGEQFDNLRFFDWYRYLNCGYRLPAVGGTDKMNASVACGAYRTYACLGQEPFSFASWAGAVRKGNTFMTSGPLLLLQVDGRPPGDEITLRSGSGKIEVLAELKSTLPVHRLEIVLNGKVVASREENGGTRDLTLRETVSVSGPGWLAARCASRMTFGPARVAAHTSPVYLVVPGQELFSAPVAAYMMTLIDGSEAWVRKLAIRPDAERYARVLKVFGEARERLHQRMHKHGIRH